MFQVRKDFSNANIARTIRFSEGMYHELSELAGRENISFNLLVLQCCRYALDRVGTPGPGE